MTQSQDAPNILRPRHTPAQQRSHEWYTRVFSSVRIVPIEYELEPFTFDEIARIADIPVGTLYQSFANKYVMIYELGHQGTVAVIGEVSCLGERVPTLEWPEFLSESVDHLAKFWRENVSRRAI